MTFVYPPWHWSRVARLWTEADELEARYGRAAALRVIDDRLAKARRRSRRRLYLLHDELARRAIRQD